MKFMEDQIQRFKPGEINAVYAHNDEMALGAIQALEAAGRLKDVVVVGIDGQNNAIQSVADGKLTATFIYPFVAPEGIQTAYKVAKGETVPKEIKLKSTMITKDNAAQYIGKGF
jgi:ribose transport system substrate-binding protein